MPPDDRVTTGRHCSTMKTFTLFINVATILLPDDQKFGSHDRPRLTESVLSRDATRAECTLFDATIALWS